MARRVQRLSAVQIKRFNEKGLYHDGAGLYLQVSPSITKSWVFRYTFNAKQRRHGLGQYPTVLLAEAREAALQCKRLLHKGIDPIEHRRASKLAKQKEELSKITFKHCAVKFIEDKKSSWKNAKHIAQWTSTLETYAYPYIGDMSIEAIDTAAIRKVLKPIWESKTETASRVRQRIENIIDYSRVSGYRTGENPARWRGHLDKMFAEPNKVQEVKHFPALPYKEMPAFFSNLRGINSLAAKALAYLILTATRSSETRLAHPKEVNADERLWIIPKTRTKSNREHRVPLSDEALMILKEVELVSTPTNIFPSRNATSAISDSVLLKLAKDHRKDLTVHGFRSTFRDWVAEQTDFPRELAEAALSHVLKDKTEAAYQRGDLLEKRRELMNQWAEFCLGVRNDDQG